MKKLREHLWFATRPAVVALAAGLGACAGDPHYYSSDPISAVVLELETRAPVQGAEILVQWEVEWPIDLGHGDESYFIEQRAVTGADGSFQVPGWSAHWVRGRVNLDDPRVTISLPGVHITYWNFGSPVGQVGTICKNQLTRNTDHWWHKSGRINVTWNTCTLYFYRLDLGPGD